MKKYIYTADGSQLIRIEDDNPMQGEDFCTSCKEDLYLFGGQACPVNPSGHYWVQYGE